MSEARITPDEVRAVARLAQLELADDELPRLTRDLDQILAHVGQLAELDVSEVPPTLGGLAAGALVPHAQDTEHAVAAGSAADLGGLRADTPVPSLPVDDALREAPRAREGGFAVPAFVDEG